MGNLARAGTKQAINSDIGKDRVASNQQQTFRNWAYIRGQLLFKDDMNWHIFLAVDQMFIFIVFSSCFM